MRGALVFSCLSIALLVAGVVLIALSFLNDRDARIEEFDGVALAWAELHRGPFSELEANITARWTGAGGETGLGPLRMRASDDRVWGFRDSEGGQGLVDFEPLRLVKGLGLPALPWAPLPRASAPTVVLLFEVSSPSLGTSSFSTLPLPLAFQEPAAPTASGVCRGVPGRRKGNVGCPPSVKRLAGVCLQIGPGGGADTQGPWLPRAPEDMGAGCDPEDGWEPARYELDPCWGPRALALDECLSPRPRHSVNVTLLSTEDPLISAEELTEDTFDFGTSPITQRVTGGGALAVGIFLSLAPLVWCCEPRCLEDEEGESLALPRPTRLGRA